MTQDRRPSPTSARPGARVVSPRVRRWVDRAIVAALLVANTVIALVWLLGDEQRVSAGAYDVPLTLAPIQTYGAVLLMLTAGVVMLWAFTEAATTLAWAGLAAFWAWWAALTLIVALQTDTASAYFPATAGVLAVVHAGTALTREG